MRVALRLVLVAAAVVFAAVASFVAIAESSGDRLGAQIVAQVTPARALATAFTNEAPSGAPLPKEFARMRRAGATFVRVDAMWAEIAPATRPAGFRPTDPAAKGYRWASLDAQVKTAVAQHLTPFIDVIGAPTWAQDGTPASSLGVNGLHPAALADFTTALTKRYGGSFRGLARVRYWEVLNEPNLDQYLLPQMQNGKAVSPEIYRDLVNAFARVVHRADPHNVVVVGGLTPFTFRSPSGEQVSIAPMRFISEFLCMSDDPTPQPTCNDRVEFDVWSHHPYTSGGPTHKAYQSGDVSLGDLPAMSAVLAAAGRAGHVIGTKSPKFWITEFSWDSNPPDKRGVPADLEARWVAEAQYRMWQSGISLLTWYAVVDQPYPASYFQSGVYFIDGKPKPAFQAFRFPVVAYPNGGKILVWGRTPYGTSGTVVVEQRIGDSWSRVGAVKTNRYGIFQGVVTGASSADAIRGRLGRETSLAFDLTPPPNEDMLVDPFG